jgi:hypothetical protein
MIIANLLYWPTLLFLVRKLCHFWIDNQAKLPADLRASLGTSLDGITVACSILIAYDLAHAGGKPASNL